MRLRHIEVFRAIMLTGTVSEAARYLHISQPAVTRMLQHAEQQLGFELFSRVKGRLLPTPEAVTLYGEVTRVFSEIERIKKTSANLRQHGTGHLRIAAIPSLAQSILPKAIQLLREKHPSITCELLTQHTQEIVNDLLSYEIDIGFSFAPPAHEAIIQDVVGQGRMVLACPRDWQVGGDAVVKFEKLSQYPFINLDDKTSLGYLVQQAFDNAGVLPHPQLEVQTYSLACSLVESGLGIAFLDQYTSATADLQRAAFYRVEPLLGFEIKSMRAKHRASSVLVESMNDCFCRAERMIAGHAESILRNTVVSLRESAVG